MQPDQTQLVSYIASYRIVGYLHGLQFSQMPLMYHELVIFTIVLFATLNLMNSIKLYLPFLCKGA